MNKGYGTHTRVNTWNRAQDATMVFTPFRIALQRSQKRLLKLHAATRCVTRLEMHGDGIFPFVTVVVALMELSDYSAVKRHCREKNNKFRRSQDARPCRQLFREREGESPFRCNENAVRFSFFTPFCIYRAFSMYIARQTRLNIKTSIT